jgi:hypothetical protein
MADAVVPDAPPRTASPLARLRSLAGARAGRAVERCELCGAPLGDEHQHLLELGTRQLACACDACAVLFSSEQGARYRCVPRRARRLADFDLPDESWDALCIPINLAFFHHDSRAGRVLAMYPSPAGATESLLPMDAWADLCAANPALGQMQVDVEALLLNRLGARRDAFLVPIDACYRLVGLIRSHWRGLSGGSAVWREIDRFFEGLSRRCGRTGGTSRA